MPAFILLLLAGIGVVAFMSKDKAGKFALSEDCQTDLLLGLPAVQAEAWAETYLVPAFERAWDGGVSVVLSGQAYTVNRLSVREVSLYLYQQLAGPSCSTVVEYNGELSFPSAAAKCLHLRMELMAKLMLSFRTGDPVYELTPEEILEVDAFCSGDEGVVIPPPPIMSLPSQGMLPAPMGATPALAQAGGGFHEAQVQVHGVSIAGASRTMRTSTTAPLDARRVAADLRSGALHPAHVLNGGVFS